MVQPLPSLPEPISQTSDIRKKPANMTFLADDYLDDDKQWKLMMDYFKKNPDALMDAIPTPTGEEEDAAALNDFKTGLTP